MAEARVDPSSEYPGCSRVLWSEASIMVVAGEAGREEDNKGVGVLWRATTAWSGARVVLQRNRRELLVEDNTVALELVDEWSYACNRLAFAIEPGWTDKCHQHEGLVGMKDTGASRCDIVHEERGPALGYPEHRGARQRNNDCDLCAVGTAAE